MKKTHPHSSRQRATHSRSRTCAVLLLQSCHSRFAYEADILVMFATHAHARLCAPFSALDARQLGTKAHKPSKSAVPRAIQEAIQGAMILDAPVAATANTSVSTAHPDEPALKRRYVILG